MILPQHGNTTWSDVQTRTWSDALLYLWQERPPKIFIPDEYGQIIDIADHVQSLSISDDINHRSSATIRIIDDDNSFGHIVTGMNVSVEYNGDLIFAGICTSVRKTYLGGFNDPIQIELDCADYTLLVARRIGRFSSDEPITCGEIVENIYNTYLVDEGLEIGRIDPGEEIPVATFQMKSISEIFDTLAEISGYIWFVDYDRKLYFIDRMAYSSDWDIDETTQGVMSFELIEGNSQYRNVQYVTGTKVRTQELTEYFKGDGKQKSFAIGYPVAVEPTIYVNDELQSVGYKGQENELIDWYWSPGDPVITQRNDAPTLSDSDVLRIDYIGTFQLIVKVKRASEITKCKLRETFGTGQYESIEYDVNASDYDQAKLFTEGLLDEYGTVGYSVNYKTIRNITSGLIQNINLPSMNINADFLVTSVRITYEENMMVYEVDAISGPLDPSWEDIFCDIAKRAHQKFVSEISESETVRGVYEFEKTWSYDESPNIFRYTYADGSTTPSDTYFPCFADGDRVIYCAVYRNGVEIFRKPFTLEEIYGNTIHSICIIDASEAIGQISHIGIWGGDSAQNVLGTGIELAKFEFIYTKSSLESLQIDVYNIRGW